MTQGTYSGELRFPPMKPLPFMEKIYMKNKKYNIYIFLYLVFYFFYQVFYKKVFIKGWGFGGNLGFPDL